MRLLAVLAVSLILSSAVLAQTNQFALGGGLFINNSEVDVDLGSDIDEELSASINLGARALIGFSDYWSFRTGLYLQEKSSRYKVDNGLLEGEVNLKFISAAVPFNLQYKLNDHISLFAGYSADFAINSYCSADGDIDSCWLTKEEKSLVHNATLGMSIVGNEKFDIDVSYQHGLSEVYDDIKIHSFLAQFFFKI